MDATLPAADGVAAAPAREAVGDSSPWAILVRDPAGEPLAAQVTVLPLTSEVQRVMEDVLGVDAELLNQTEPFREVTATAEGKASFQGQVVPGEVYAWASLAGYATAGRYITLPEPDPDRRTLTLPPSPPLEVQVQDDEGRPLAGIEVYFSSPTLDQNYSARSWRERLERRFFLTSVATDAGGRARLDWPLEGPMTVVAGLEPGFAKAFLYEARAGKQNVLVLYRPASVSGRVVDSAGRPLEKAEVTFLGMDGNQTIGIGDAITGEDGSYEVEISTRFPMAVGIALSPGKAFLLQSLAHPLPGEHREMDFQLEDAVPLDIRVVDAAGRPAAGVSVLFKETPLDWVPGVYQADENGAFRMEHWLARGRKYMAWVMRDGLLVDIVEFQVPEAPGEVRLVLKEAARLGRVRIPDGELESLAWVSRGQFGRGTGWAPDAAMSPVLPPGPGRLEAHLADGTVLLRSLCLRPGDNGDLTLEVNRTELRFDLPSAQGGAEGRGETGWTALLRAVEGDRPVAEGEAHPGSNRLLCQPGTYCLEVTTPGGDTLRRGPFQVPVEGLALGLLEPEPAAAIRVRVVDGDDHPAAGVDVRAYGRFAAAANRLTTGEDGVAVFPGLAPGLWTVRAYPFLSTLSPYAKLERDVRLGPGEQAELVFRIAPDRLFRGRVAGEVGDEVHGFRLAGDGLELDYAAADGTFTLGVPEAGDWAGAVGYAPGRSTVVCRRFQAPVTSYTFPTGGLLAKRLRVTGEEGAALEWWLAGRRLPGRAFPDAEGELALAVPPGAPLTALLRFPDGSVRRLDPARLADGQEFGPGGGAARSLQVVRPDGGPVAGARVTAPGLEYDLVTDAHGRVFLPDGPDGEGMEIRKADSWTTRVPPGTPRVVLRRDLAEVAVDVAAGLGAAQVRLEPRFDLGRPLDPRLAPVEDGEARFRHLPEGEWVATALDGTGQVLTTAAVRFLAGVPGPLVASLR